jgi:hypothetical protein
MPMAEHVNPKILPGPPLTDQRLHRGKRPGGLDRLAGLTP